MAVLAGQSIDEVIGYVQLLQIVCAGVWHNGLLCLACWLSALLLPVLLLPLYSTGQGAVIWWGLPQIRQTPNVSKLQRPTLYNLSK